MSGRIPSLLFALFLSGLSCTTPSASGELSTTAEFQRRFQDLAEITAFDLRYNPATCDCPPWEVSTPDGWVRVSLLGGQEIRETLQEQAWTDHGSELNVTYAAEGSLSGRVLRCTPSTPCGEFTLTQWLMKKL
jgi:hypothetical protein